MAWSWSHTQEAYANAEANLRNQLRDWLEIVYAEWRANQVKGGAQGQDEEFCNRRYERALKYAKQPEITNDELANFIWERMENLATCTDGGWNAWCCPYGCHTVPFSKEETEAA